MAAGRVLVVDDDRDLCDLLSDFLIEEGYDVSRAYAGRDAIDAARGSPPDAVLPFLEKPFSLAAVQAAVRDALGTGDAGAA